MNTLTLNRSLSKSELDLALWMLQNGTQEAREFIPQLEVARVTPWKCPCGCAGINFKVGEHPEAPPGVNILGDLTFGSEDSMYGIFIFESNGLLSGIEVSPLAVDTPRVLPSPSELKPF